MMKRFGKLFEMLAFVIVFIFFVAQLVVIINVNWPFLVEGSTIVKAISFVNFYSGLALMGIVGLYAATKANFVVRILIYLCIAIIVIFQFFPGTWDYILQIATQTV